MNQKNKLSGFEEVTEIFQPLDLGENSKGSRYFVILKRGRNVKFTHRPTGPKVLIGRSSESDLQIDDPYFPRKAAELVTDPLPLLRFSAKENDRGLVHQIKTGEAVKFFGYKLYLLERGDSTRNYPAGDTANRGRTIILILIGTAALSVLMAMAHPPKPQYHGLANPEVTVSLGSQLEKYSSQEIASVRSANTKIPAIEPTLTRKKGLHKQSPTDRNSIKKATHFRLKMDSSSFSHQQDDISVSLAKALKASERRFSDGDIEGSSRLIEPFIPLLSAGQKRQVVDRLEPYAEKIYRRAYILRPYDSDTAARMMDLLASKGLKLLPSVKKAASSLNREKKR